MRFYIEAALWAAIGCVIFDVLWQLAGRAAGQ